MSSIKLLHRLLADLKTSSRSPRRKQDDPKKCHTAVLVLLLCLCFSLASLSTNYQTFISRFQFVRSVEAERPLLQPSSRNPPKISEIYPVVRPPNPSPPLPFTTPQILVVYKRKRTASSHLHDLAIYTSGLVLIDDIRTFNVTGCVIANIVYTAYATPYEYVRCTVSQSPSPHATISLLLDNDGVLQRALSFKPVEVFDVNVTLPQGVIVDPPEDLSYMANGSLHEFDHVDAKMLRSNITWSTFPSEKLPLDEITTSPRHHICLVTMIKPFAESLKHWVAYHRTIGVDKVFILDNLSDYPIAQDFAGKEDTEILYWPFARAQIQGLSYLLHALRTRCEWVITADVDEFIFPGTEGAGNEKPLAWFLKEQARRGVQMASFSYINIAENRTTATTEPMPLVYTHLSRLKHHTMNRKSACRTDFDWVGNSIHECKTNGTNGIKVEVGVGPMEPVDVRSIPRLVHYKVRSWEEYKAKAALGSPSIKGKRKPRERAEKEFPKWFGDITKNATEWTFFKNRYEMIMRRYDENEEMLVWNERGKRCELRKNDVTGWKGEVLCGVKDQSSISGGSRNNGKL